MDRVLRKNIFSIIVLVSTSILSGCFDTEDSANSDWQAFGNAVARTPIAANGNTAPAISGNPSGVAPVGSTWSFTPNASDSDGDRLSFSITNRPSWAAFDNATGRLSGAPEPGHEGNYTNINITVTDGLNSTALESFAVVVQKGSANNAPTISGTPATAAIVDQMYSFTPTANDADGDNLTFNIANRPTWATFNAATGQLSGIPQQGDSAVYNNIVISVSDGELMNSLSPFAINVAQSGGSAVTLNWTAPTENEDGTALTDLAAYKLYYGLSEGNYPNEIPVNNPGLTAYVIDNLAPNTYYFAATSINSKGVESDFSNVRSKVVN